MEPTTDQVTNGIAFTTMAIREELMQYFKGDCVQRLTYASNVRVMGIEVSMKGLPNYERVAIKNARRALLRVGDAPILELSYNPAVVVFNTGVLRRSPQLKDIEAALRKFFAEYLPGVEVKDNNGAVLYG